MKEDTPNNLLFNAFKVLVARPRYVLHNLQLNRLKDVRTHCIYETKNVDLLQFSLVKHISFISHML